MIEIKELSKEKISFARDAIRIGYRRREIADYLGISMLELAKIAPYKRYYPFCK